MKKPLSHTFKVVGYLLLTCLLVGGIGVSYAWFRDRDAKAGKANMAAVDIELKGQEFIQEGNGGEASFIVTNKSNIDIYLRAGIIFELTTESGEPVIADTSGIAVGAASQGWYAEKKTLTDGGAAHRKWFLAYGDGADYTKAAPGTNPEVNFTVSGIPAGCKLIVNVVPEAVQVDKGDDAIKDLKSSVNPAW